MFICSVLDRFVFVFHIPESVRETTTLRPCRETRSHHVCVFTGLFSCFSFSLWSLLSAHAITAKQSRTSDFSCYLPFFFLSLHETFFVPLFLLRFLCAFNNEKKKQPATLTLEHAHKETRKNSPCGYLWHRFLKRRTLLSLLLFSDATSSSSYLASEFFFS